MDTPPPSHRPRVALAITNLGKLAGLVGGTVEAVGPARTSAILYWLALYLGAQALEDLVARIIDRTLGR